MRTGWKKKILVANDSAEMRFLTEEAFTMEGYTVVLAEIAEEALELQPKAKCLVVFPDFY